MRVSKKKKVKDTNDLAVPYICIQDKGEHLSTKRLVQKCSEVVHKVNEPKSYTPKNG